MSLLSRAVGDVRSRALPLFSSKGSRFRLAVSCGFVVAAAGALSVGVGDRPGFAQGWGDFGGGLFGGGSFFGQPEQQPLTVRREPTYQSRRVRHPSIDDRAMRYRSRDIRAARFGRPHREARADVKADTRLDQGRGGPITLNRISLCVRTCDGFAFPVGAYHGEQDRDAHEATCQSECPGAQTSLYILPAGADSIGEAVNLRSGQAYSALPHAFHYTTVLSDSCGCHAKSGSRIASVLRDYTLRRGDAVMTGHGVQVFHGATHFPFKPNDFVALAKSRDIRSHDRAAFDAIERASMVGSKTTSTPPETERQASR